MNAKEQAPAKAKPAVRPAKKKSPAPKAKARKPAGKARKAAPPAHAPAPPPPAEPPASAPLAAEPTPPVAQPPPAAARQAAPSSDEIPFSELSRDAASAFLYAALLPEETLSLVKQLGLGRPGFRPEALGEVERCDLVADEARAHPPAAAAVLEVLRRGLKEPAFPGSGLDPAAAEELLEVAASDHGLAITLWRLLADPQPAVRQRGGAALEKLAAEWYGPPPEGTAGPPPTPAGRGGGDGGGEAAARKLQSLEEKLVKAEARGEEARQRADQQRDKLQAQVKEARAEAARAVEEAARAREAAEGGRAAARTAEAALTAARASDAAAEVGRLRAALREAEVRLHGAEALLTRAGEREQTLIAAIREAEGRAATPGEGLSSGPAQPSEEPEEAPATWLLPIFTPEFYDSMQGWDRRIQRAALKQAFLLSQDWRHPSLRALALEGLPGYYRVRVATDVRLIYRRGERQDAVELCSLIDREDLDRYVRQAKTR